jgi:hypothetical protein
LDPSSPSSTMYTLVMRPSNFVCSGPMLLKNSRWFTLFTQKSNLNTSA